MRIYIVAFGPSQRAASNNGVGGYDWFYEKEAALRELEVHIKSERTFADNVMDYVFFPVDLPPEAVGGADKGTLDAQQNIEQWIEQNLELP